MSWCPANVRSCPKLRRRESTRMRHTDLWFKLPERSCKQSFPNRTLAGNLPFFFAIQFPMLFAPCIIKYFLAIIATLDNMQRKTRNNNPWHARHNKLRLRNDETRLMGRAEMVRHASQKSVSIFLTSGFKYFDPLNPEWIESGVWNELFFENSVKPR
jgi:hypothetical protein